MRKGLLFLFGAITFMFITMPNVYAATTITQIDFDAAKGGTPTNGISYNANTYTLDAGEYTIGGDITLADNENIEIDGTTTINLNGKTITGSLMDELISVVDGEVTLSGTGIVNNTNDSGLALYQEDGVIIINGNITFTKPMEFDAIVAISGGTYNGINVGNMGNITINAGTFNTNAIGGAGLQLNECTSLINNGVFTSDVTSVMIMGGTHRVTGGTFTGNGYFGIQAIDVTELKITGGTFTGLFAGLGVEGNGTIKLSGGTFKATGNGTGVGAILMYSNNSLADLLASGYKYSAGSNFLSGDYGLKYTAFKETTVVSESASGVAADDSTTTTAATTYKNPNTGDNILVYVILLMLSGLGAVVTVKKLRKSM